MDARSVLEAGGVVPAGSAVDLPVDTLSARIYAHPAIGGRAVVRLVPDALGGGSDTWMGTFGFGLRQTRSDLGVQQRRQLGFPWWSLVHQPKTAPLVLEQQPAFRKARRLAASKPGHAKDAFAEIATVFERRAPTVLPTFWEEAGRVYVELGNPKMAATCFDKGRAAEATFGLEVDQERLGEVFLEFALAGAVTVKSLQAWAKQLAGSLGAAEAWERFRKMAIRRTLGGMPPWASFAKDLSGLAKAAGKDPEVERRAWLAEILDAPALGRATPSFWKDHAEALEDLAREDRAVRRTWLWRLPKAGAGNWSDIDEEFADAWLEGLHRAGVLADAWTDPEVDAARWLRDLSRWAPDGYGRLLPVARRVGARLASEGASLQLGEDDRCDIDFLDLLLEVGVGVTLHEDQWLDVRQWTRGEPVDACLGLPAEHRPRDPVHLAAHATLGPRLVSAASRVLGDDGFEQATASSPVMAQVRRTALRGWLDRLLRNALPDAAEVISDLAELSVQRLRDEPELWRILESVDLADTLVASLRGGLFHELGWPAFDEAVAELGTEDLKLQGPWPFTVLMSPRRAVVLGPDGARHATIDLKLPKDTDPVAARWIGDQLLVGWRKDGDAHAAWSGRWGSAFPADLPWWDRNDAMAARLPDGSWYLGEGAPIAPGADRWPSHADFVHDGERFWRWVDDGLAPLDPHTGRTSPGPAPSFFAGIERVELRKAEMRFVPGRGPWALRRVGDRTETLDGLVWEGAEDVGALVILPGDPRPRALAESWRELKVLGPDGVVTDSLEDDDEEPRPSLDRVHWLVPRDPVGSETLRGIDRARARAVMDAVREAPDDDTATVALRGLMPELTHPRLITEVYRTVLWAIELETDLKAFLTKDESGEAPARPGGPTVDALLEALGLAVARGVNGDDEHDPMAVMTRDAAFLAGADVSVGTFELDWLELGRSVPAMGFVLARPGLAAEERDLVLAFLRAWVDLPDLVVRRSGWTFPDLASPFLVTERDDGERHLVERWSRVDEGGRWIASTDDTWSDEGPFDVTTLSTSDATPPAATVDASAVTLDLARDRAWARALVAAAEAEGLREALPEGAAARLSELTGLSEPAATLLLVAAPRFDRWGNDFLGAELRERLGLKRNDADLARDELRRLGRNAVSEVLRAAAPADPRDCWGPGGVTSLAEALVARFGKRLPIPPELRAACDKALGDGDILDLVAGPEGSEVLTADRACAVDDDGDVKVEGGEALTMETVGRVQSLLPWLMEQLPVGDPLLANAARVARAVEQRLAFPGLLLDAGISWATTGKKARSLFDTVGGELTPATAETWARRDTGGLVVSLDDETIRVLVRPTRLGDDDLRVLAQLGDSLDDDDLRTSAHVMAVHRAGRTAAVAARLDASGAPAGSQECDPRRSAPDTLARVRSELGLSEAAACLFLQTLALLQPTKKAVQAWNGWTPKVYAAAAAELVGRGLLLEAKRARAGRDHFLPGPWVDGPRPFEQWKGALLDGKERKGELVLPREPAVALDAPHTLFERAWARWSGGDRPRFG